MYIYIYIYEVRKFTIIKFRCAILSCSVMSDSL